MSLRTPAQQQALQARCKDYERNRTEKQKVDRCYCFASGYILVETVIFTFLNFFLFFLSWEFMKFTYFYDLWYRPFFLFFALHSMQHKHLPSCLAAIAIGTIGLITAIRSPMFLFSGLINIAAVFWLIFIFFVIRKDQALAEQDGYPYFNERLAEYEETRFVPDTKLVAEIRSQELPPAAVAQPKTMEDLDPFACPIPQTEQAQYKEEDR